MQDVRDDLSTFGPWNPGISSQIPPALRGLATIHRGEHVSTRLDRVDEIHDLTGIERAELVAFRPERLVLHELLIRVTADLSVNDGSKIEDLGINFRRMTQAILARGIAPAMPRLAAAHAELRDALAATIGTELARASGSGADGGPAARGASSDDGAAAGARAARPVRGWFAWFRREPASPPPPPPLSPEALVAEWDRRAARAEGDVERAACRALARVGSALVVRHGGFWVGRDVFAATALDIAGNDLCAARLGALIEPLIAKACADEGFVPLAPQPHPLVMNTKGASASGKSTMRPLQKALAERIGVSFADFALISPDVWRKQLLDYDSLGADYKYAGAFTGEELAIVDQKLDRYMAQKAERGGMTHLLIDRFRFDSFAPDSDEAGSNLLTRFGATVYLFFMITPPAATVVRAWKRGLDVGRYKAVDDVLAHNVQAYAGIPALFLTWARRQDKRVHCEFLDNSVGPGERPLTIAYGWNDAMNVLDVGRLLDIVRYQRIDIDATRPEDLFRDKAAIAPARCTGFVEDCVRALAEVNFADRATGRVWLRLERGRPVWADPEPLAAAVADADARATVAAVAPAALAGTLPAPPAPVFLGEYTGALPNHALGSLVPGTR